MILPELTPNGTADPGSALPPRGFVPLEGAPTHVTWTERRNLSVVALGETKRRGLRYEAAVTEMLTREFPIDFHSQPAFAFRSGLRTRVCIPDGLLLRSHDAILFEIKIQHMPEAWWQLRKLYQPVVERWWEKPIQVCEIVKSFDPSMGFPEEPVICASIEAVLNADPSRFKVFIWRPANATP